MRLTTAASLLALLAYEFGRHRGVRRAIRAVEDGHRRAVEERLRAFRGELV